VFNSNCFVVVVMFIYHDVIIFWKFQYKKVKHGRLLQIAVKYPISNLTNCDKEKDFRSSFTLRLACDRIESLGASVWKNKQTKTKLLFFFLLFYDD
jgi:hypothetical protein